MAAADRSDQGSLSRSFSPFSVFTPDKTYDRTDGGNYNNDD